MEGSLNSDPLLAGFAELHNGSAGRLRSADAACEIGSSSDSDIYGRPAVESSPTEMTSLACAPWRVSVPTIPARAFPPHASPATGQSRVRKEWQEQRLDRINVRKDRPATGSRRHLPLAGFHDPEPEAACLCEKPHVARCAPGPQRDKNLERTGNDFSVDRACQRGSCGRGAGYRDEHFFTLWRLWNCINCRSGSRTNYTGCPGRREVAPIRKWKIKYVTRQQG